jgi:AhpD family alkylhydroperoxidase
LQSRSARASQADRHDRARIDLIVAAEAIPTGEAARQSPVLQRQPRHNKPAEWTMATVKLLSDNELSPEARAVFDDIRRTRQSDFVNNFWRALAHDPKTLRRTWESVKEVMAPGVLEPKIKEMLYVAVSIAHGCTYCIHSHTASARAKGMTDAEYAEMIAIVGMAAETNRLVTALGVPVDDAFLVDPSQDGTRNL